MGADPIFRQSLHAGLRRHVGRLRRHGYYEWLSSDVLTLRHSRAARQDSLITLLLSTLREIDALPLLISPPNANPYCATITSRITQL